MGERVTYEEQEAMGLIRNRSKFVAPVRNEIVRKPAPVPVVDQYVDAPMPAEIVAQYHADPITRYKAMQGKVREVGLFLSVLTGALMLVMQWYPADYRALSVFLLWLALAAAEYVGLFVLLAVLDYKETPAALTWYKMKALVRFMGKEQDHKLREMYPLQYDESYKRKW